MRILKHEPKLTSCASRRRSGRPLRAVGNLFPAERARFGCAVVRRGQRGVSAAGWRRVQTQATGSERIVWVHEGVSEWELALSRKRFACETAHAAAGGPRRHSSWPRSCTRATKRSQARPPARTHARARPQVCKPHFKAPPRGLERSKDEPHSISACAHSLSRQETMVRPATACASPRVRIRAHRPDWVH
eukprot:1923894-Pleurochrysis_carterae.AAC.5